MSAKAKTDPLAEVASRYAVAITPAMEALIDPTNPEDPIAAQFRPDARELDVAPDELGDPIGDEAHTRAKGVVHRYADRALLKLVHVCPVYCRFCFRREMVGPDREPGLTPEMLDGAIDYIAARAEISEVILTGGDPLGRGLRASELERETPYNTYKILGLPPTPIANPGRAAIEAVLNPAESDALYFVADGSGGHVFASTLDDHNRNVAQWRRIERAGREEG